MCRKVTCNTCQKPGWAGCGAHVEAVLGNVPEKDRCACGRGEQAKDSLFSKFLGR